MTIDIPKYKELFRQRDVRETETSTSAVTGTLYWSCSGCNFIPLNPDVNDVSYSQASSYVQADADNISFVAPVFLPHGAVVTSVIVYGNAGASAETWILSRATLNSSIVATMATNTINSSDSTITDATIINNTRSYFLQTSSLDTGDRIFGVRIIYTI